MFSTARTRNGEIKGRVVDGVHTFLGVPYAAPPVGPLHLCPPQPARPWTGPRDTTIFGAEPYQLRPPPEVQALVPDPAIPGPDCLNLNVWTPALDAARRPVMVWIPGGAFEAGTGATYDGSRFARDGVVCVTINYRVGIEGFVYLPDEVANLGLLDQVEALKWVRDNIAAFGGDPGNVTIFGESAGAMSVGTLLAVPRAEGLFRRAIAQSGAAHAVLTAADARRMAQHLAEFLEVPATREALAAVTPERLLEAHAELKSRIIAHPDPAVWGGNVVASATLWQPTIDGDVLPANPLERIAAGASAGVDLIVGTNTEDWRLFTAANGLGQITEAVLTGPVAKHGFSTLAAYGLPADRALAAYRAAYPGAAPALLLAAVQTDWWVRIPAIRLAEARASGPGRTYMYEFAWPSPAFNGLLGACHALEIPFVFDTLDKGANQMMGGLLGPSPPQALATAMHRAWVSFARTGDPQWPRYETSRRATQRFNAVSQVVDDPRARERAFWEGLR